MNATERAKVAALAAVRIPDFGYGSKLIRNLLWRRDKNPTAPLSANEKYLLDLMCWHYRNKLGGLVPFDLPLSEPRRADYTRSDAGGAVQERLL